MSSFGCTILHDCLVVPEEGLGEILMVPARGWEHFPGLLADLSQFPIVQARDVLDQLEVIIDLVLVAQVRFVHIAERLNRRLKDNVYRQLYDIGFYTFKCTSQLGAIVNTYSIEQPR